MSSDKETKAAYDRRNYQFFRAAGLCVRCHEQDAFTMAGRARCAECMEISRAQKARHMAKNPGENTARARDWYDRVKNEGRCVKCGRPVEDPAYYVTCQRCRAKQRKRDAERRIQAGRYAKEDTLVCGVCNRRPPMEGKRTCRECYEQNLRNLEKANAARSTKITRGGAWPTRKQ